VGRIDGRLGASVIRAACVILLAGCTSATATIANEANDIQSASARARAHLTSATQELDAIDDSAASVHMSVAYVSDDESPIWSTAKFLSVAVVAGCVAAVVYKLKK
jgi:ribonuclease PH